jgi:hypothetical protein
MVEEPMPPVPLAAQIIDPRPAGATIQAARLIQDHGAPALAQSIVAEKIPATPRPAPDPCADAFLSGVCRERMRWSHCHPDRWDAVPECVVQKFDVSYSVN